MRTRKEELGCFPLLDTLDAPNKIATGAICFHHHNQNLLSQHLPSFLSFIFLLLSFSPSVALSGIHQENFLFLFFFFLLLVGRT